MKAAAESKLCCFLFSISLFAVPDQIFADDAEQLFVRRIQPLLSEKCLSCHGNDPGKIKGGLDLRTQESARRGGDSGKPAFVPLQPGESPIYLSVSRQDENWVPMPPKEADKLSAEQIGWIKEWISGGAPWPDESRAQEIARGHAIKWSVEDGVTVATSGGLSPEWTNRKYKPEDLWAYQPVKKPALNQEGPAAIDTLIARRMPPDIASAPPAEPRVFIRRATFDLTGLPPSPEEISKFEADFARDADGAVRSLIDRLLDSPHYGERMAQHWLDVVRYADSSGFANDYERGNAWRYRDYVVRAFNNDKPYNQFVREQIAGDELDPNDSEKLVATGFLRMGPWELTGMEVPKIARQRFLDDVSNSVGETFLAHSLQCARCHDHKFDPIPTQDYYALQAVFATTQFAERSAPFLPSENISGFEERKYLEASKQAYQRAVKEVSEKITLAAAREWLTNNNRDAAEFEKVVTELAAASDQGEQNVAVAQARKLMQDREVHPDLIPPQHVGFAPEDYGNERVARKGLERLRWELDRYEPFALSVYSGRTPAMSNVYAPLRMPDARMEEGELEETCVLTGGDPFAQGMKVKPGVLSVLGSAQMTPVPDEIEGRRKVFADWVASADNPLTTRAIVNRIWMWHFGDAIAGNPNNFGSTGKKPTHPELLDWLAAKFVEEGWSLKKLHRVIMMSAVYRRSAVHPDYKALSKADPLGTSYAVFKPRRLSAEEQRDAMLAATGELNRTLGGIPNRPEINLEAALQPRQVMGTFAAAWVANPLPEQRHRRSLYALKLRGLRDPAMEVFNAPAPDFSCERRELSTVTPQVFALFNSKTSYARALALAARAKKESANDEAAVVRCFELTYGRTPRREELIACLAHWREMELIQSNAKFTSSKPPLEVRRDAIEENTGEKFSFNERLHAYADFVPDLQPGDCDVRTRALADVCLALLNSNEFAYVY